MATMARETWTDERLDDLKVGMHREFEGVTREFAQVRRELDTRFNEVDRRFDQVERGFDEVNGRIETLGARFDAMQRTLLGGFLAVVAATIAAGIF